MPADRNPVPADRSAVISTLRAAGCVYAEDEADLLLAVAQMPAELAQLVAQRVAGRPLEHVVGWAQFCGLRIAVGPGVFVPRRRTEFLAARAVELARGAGADAVVVDLCCGAGALAAAVLAAVPTVQLFAADIDATAAGYARRNLPGRAEHVYVGDLFAPLPPGLCGRIDVLTVNTPYVPTAEIDLLPAEARLHEPRFTLDGGDDGLDVQRRLAAQAPSWLAPGGWVLVETSKRQAAVAAAVFTSAGLAARVHRDDDLGATVVLARSAGSAR